VLWGGVREEVGKRARRGCGVRGRRGRGGSDKAMGGMWWRKDGGRRIGLGTDVG